MPDTFYPGGRYPPVLNAFHGSEGNDREHRVVMEFNIETLSGIDIDSATLYFSDCYDVGGYTSSQNCLSGLYGDGTITLDDWSQVGNLITTLPGTLDPQTGHGTGGLDSLSLDVTAFIQSAINSDQHYAGFVLWQASSINGVTFEHGAELIVAANTDFQVPSANSIQVPVYPGPQYSGVPEPTTLIIWSVLGTLGMAGGWYRRRKAAPTLQEGHGGPRRASGDSRAVQGNARP
jgi:hypothetical protein